MSLRLEGVQLVGPSGRALGAPVSVNLARGEIKVHRCSPAEGDALLRTIVGLQPPRQGEVEVDGVSVTAWGVHRRVVGYVEDEDKRPIPRGPMVGFVCAEGGLLPQLTVEQNILYWCSPPKSREPMVRVRRRGERLRRQAQRLQLTPVLSRQPDGLAGPEPRFKVAMARAAFNEPPVLVTHFPSKPDYVDRLEQIYWQAVLPSSPHDHPPSDRYEKRPWSAPWQEPAWLALSEDDEVCRKLQGTGKGG